MNISNILRKVVASLGAAMFVYLLSISINVSKNDSQMFSWPLLVAETIAATIIAIVLIRIFENHVMVSKWFLILACVFSVLLQIFMATHFIGDNIWDGLSIMMQGYDLGRGNGHWMSYFSSFPNNVNPALILGFLLRVFPKLSTSSIAIMLNLIMMFLFDLTLFSCFLILKKRVNVNIATVILMVMVLFFPFYALALFFYPDALAISFPVLSAVCIEKFCENTRFKWYWLGTGIFLLIVGIEMKTNVAVFAIGLLIAFVLFFDCSYSRYWIKNAVLVLLVFGIVTAGTIGATKLIQTNAGYETKNQYKIPWQHWTMMGLNTQSHGAVSSEDYAYTVKRPTLAKKKKADQSQIQKRLNKMGIAGFFEQMQNKTILQWQDSAVSSYSVLNQYRRYSAGYNFLMGNKSALWRNLNQVIYIMALLLAALSCVVRIFKSKTNNDFFSWYWALLSVIGIFLFHNLLWESENRYAYIVLPFLFILAGTGLNNLNSILKSMEDAKPYKGTLTLIATIMVAFATWGMVDNWALTKPVEMQNIGANQVQVNKVKEFGHGRYVKQTVNVSKAFNTIKLQVPLNEHVEYQVTNDQGQKLAVTATVLSENNDNFNFQLNTMTQPAGLYHIYLKNNGHEKLGLYYLDSGNYCLTNHVFNEKPNSSLAYSFFEETMGYNIRRSMLVGIYLILILLFICVILESFLNVKSLNRVLGGYRYGKRFKKGRR
ncbi:membrane protein [Furfurilactobacillus rossiae]|uniref:glycosyltransferase family 39 protein n=1 Tax=Furfurilactobacillus rossiae TaxID=231049 RepID=UPI0015B887EE|nr:glycosyltransferase family 39 protein [Furfurilactobacillus rossiae]MCF6165369.1 glycosyltransferase family 39 protein [Furfurilactobacillus rossiae]QLE63729.1 membrane protein [Furfurilactobacillus rossiae]